MVKQDQSDQRLKTAHAHAERLKATAEAMKHAARASHALEKHRTKGAAHEKRLIDARHKVLAASQPKPVGKGGMRKRVSR